MKRITTLILSLVLLLFTVGDIQAQSTTGSVSGTIKTSDGNPAPYVSVSIKDSNKGTVSSESGTYTIKGLKEGTYTLKITYTGVQPQEKTIQITAGKSVQSDIALAESANKLAEIQIISNRSVNQKSVTVGKSGILAKDLPQAIQIIDTTMIADQQANRLADVIKNVNGIVLGENRGSTGDSFFARGYSLGGNNVLKNGARSSIGGSPEVSTLESVEVLKGSAALLYGGVTGGAVVNMVTKKPKFNYGGEVSVRTGSYNFYKPTIDVYGPISKKIAFRAIATLDDAGSFRDNVTSDRIYVNPSFLFKIGQKTELLVQGDYLKSDYTPDFGIGTIDGKIENIGRNVYLNTPWAYNKTNTVTSQINLDHKFNDNWKINVVGSVQSYNRNYYGAERPAAAVTGIVARNLSRSQSKEFTFNEQVNLTGSFKIGSIGNTVLVGADADQSRTNSNSFVYPGAATTANPYGPTAYNYGNVNLLDPSTYYGSGIMPEPRVLNNTIAPVFRMGGFVQDLVSVTEKLKVLAGIRWTFQKTPLTRVTNVITGQPVIATVAANTPPPADKFDKAFSPKIGIVYQAIKNSSIYVSYANNFTSNSGTDIFFAPLAPSIIDQYEVGVKNDLFGNKMSLNVTWYKIINSNFAQTAQFDASGVANTNTTIKEFSGKTASEGIEIDIAGKLAKTLNFMAGYSYSYYRYLENLPSGIKQGERVIGTIPHTANGTVFYTFGTGAVKGLKIGASGFYYGKRNAGFQLTNIGQGRAAPIYLSSYQTFDVSAGYTFRKLSVLGKLSNITNELSYLVHENYSINPIPPRMFSATLAYKFNFKK